ncbi:MAG: type 1 secretion system HlyD family membrane fusion component [Phormidesmis priestleyi Ana]|uniref:Type 1 secretion system HlyD family membrane fusion component n=1 Tax=Phormidesmis priestleyi Ana TaxID=1666911 RepID=A0A0P7Z0H4_9CYAN|nr:MAG: type 1 secretion system HlyD family membrane fusion component [Phormidesmis priestleyi Ana]
MAVSNYVQSTDRASQNWLARAQSVGWSESIQSVLEQPPAAFPRYLILLGLAFTGFFGLWAWTGTMQEVSQAQGELLPLGDTYKIQSATVGALDKIWVKEGDRIRQGQLLFELDATTAQSEVTRLEQTLAATQQTLDQTLALMSDMQAESVSQAQIAAASIQAQIATQAQSQANMQTSQALLEGLGSEMAAQQERLTRISSLESQGAISKEYLFGIEQGVRDQQKAIVQTQGEFEQALARTRQVAAELDQKRAEAQQMQLMSQQSLKKLSIEAEQLQATLSDTKTLLAEAKARLAQSQVRSPSNGILSSLELDNAGEFIQLGQTLAEVVPDSTPLVLSAMVPQPKAGLIKPGMTTQIKLDAFPYQTYGVMSGKVLSISPDAKRSPEIGSGYQVQIALEKDYVMHEKEPVPLHVGQTASAEIIVSQRRILDLILDPIRRLRSDEMSL